MRISIAMCTYNGSRHLREQLDSFARQSLSPYELIVCDDGSQDETLSMIESFAHTVTFPVRVFRNERNLGSTKNFEKAIGLCEGELIALADQDDEWRPDKLERLNRVFEEMPEALAAFTDAEIMDDESELVGRRLWASVNFVPEKSVAYAGPGLVRALLRLDYIATGATMVFRSEFRDRFMPIPESWVHDAWIAWIAALYDGLAAVPETTIRYRVHQRQQIGVAPAKLTDRLELVRKNVAIFELVASRLKALERYLEQHLDDARMAGLLSVLGQKIRYMEARASLTRSSVPRIFWILGSWRDYQRFARGPIAMLSDAFVVGRGEARSGEQK